MKIVVTGQIARYPLGGVTWDWLNYLLGFRKLGHSVHYFEDGSKWLYNPVKNTVMLSDYNVNYLKNVMNEFGLSSNWTYFARGDKFTGKNNIIYGNKKIMDVFKSADIIFNIAGSSDMDKLVNDFSIPKKVRKVYIDGDPMINQIKILKGDKNIVSSSHDSFFTYAENIGNANCKIPKIKNIKWNKTRFPVVLNVWNYKIGNKAEKFTTVSNWQSYKGFIFNGKKYSGSKSIEFIKYASLPKKTHQMFEIALAVDAEKKKNILLKKRLKNRRWVANADNLDKMKKGGWVIANALLITKSSDSYKKYIYDSRGEWSVAKPAYVKANTGWFSCRSTCYLAAGKPVILEDTGFSKFIPTGKGLFSFKNMEEAVNAINEVNNNYEYHCKEARKIAEKYFDSDKILGKMLKDCEL